MEPFHQQGIDKKIINCYLTVKRWTLNMSYQVVSSHPHMSTTLQIIVCIFQNEMKNRHYKNSFHNFKMAYMYIINHKKVLHQKILYLTICRQFLQPKTILLYQESGNWETYILRILSINLLTFFAFGKTNNICNAEGQTHSYNKEIISLKPYE